MYDNVYFRTYKIKFLLFKIKMKNLKISNDLSNEIYDIFLKKDKLAVDLELHGLNINRDEICLVQICDDEKNIALVKPNTLQSAPLLKKIMLNRKILKVFHYALSDVCFFRASLKWNIKPFCCTKIMSKLIRTYTQSHGLKDLHKELLNVELDKEKQQTDWSSNELSEKQIIYAANDVLRLLEIYNKLNKMILNRKNLKNGISFYKLNKIVQSMLPGYVELLLNGYGDNDYGWVTSIFNH